jgi:hypothetical protein
MKVTLTDFGLPIIQNGAPTEEVFDTVKFMKETLEEYLNRKLGLGPSPCLQLKAGDDNRSDATDKKDKHNSQQ